MAGVTVRASSPGDAEAVEGLRIAGWKTAYQGIMPDDYLDSLPVDVGRRRRHLEDLPPGVTDEVAVADGTVTDGTVTDGTATDGTATDGTATDGAGADGTATDGTAADGTATDGTATDGAGADGTATDGTAADGTATDGTVTDGTATDGAGADGTATDGTAADGTATDGTATDGTATDGTAADGAGAGGTGADGAIVGWVAYGTCRDPDRAGPRYGEIFACYVHPDWWRKGTGRLLMGHAIDGLVRSGRDDISLWVLEANDRARRFYEALGFAPDGTRKLVNFGVPVPEVRYRRPPAS
jgi:ribosomal protein S18 acetylase RimI-like enzyme